MAISPEEKARRKHNDEVRQDRANYKEDIKTQRDVLKHLYGMGRELPQEIFKIMEDIIETQNKGVPLSAFQKKMLKALEKSFVYVRQDELQMPRIVTEKDPITGDVETKIKDLHIKVNDKFDLTDFKLNKSYRGHVLQDLLPVGATTYDIIQLISETISENARLVQIIQGKPKLTSRSKGKSDKKQDSHGVFALPGKKEGQDKFHNAIVELQELN